MDNRDWNEYKKEQEKENALTSTQEQGKDADKIITEETNAVSQDRTNNAEQSMNQPVPMGSQGMDPFNGYRGTVMNQSNTGMDFQRNQNQGFRQGVDGVNQNNQRNDSNNLNPSQGTYSHMGQQRNQMFEQNGMGQQNTYHSNGNYIPSMPSANHQDKKKKEKKQQNSQQMQLVKRAGAIALAAVLFGAVAGGTFLGVNMLQDQIIGKDVSVSIANDENTEQEIVKESTTLGEKAEAALSIAEQNEKKNTSVATNATGEQELSVKQLVSNNMSSIVAITNKGIQEVRTMWGNFEQESQSSGSGIIIGKTDTELLIVTNYHVVSGCKELTVVFSFDENNEEPSPVTAKVKGYEEGRDLAVIAIPLDSLNNDLLSKISIAVIGDSDNLCLGEQVVAIGNALGYGQSVTVGYVSALNRSVELTAEDGTEISNHYIQTDAAINPGNSGGALFNMKGELIGINSAKVVLDSVDGIGYAIPITEVTDIIQELMNSVTRDMVADEDRGYLGIAGNSVDINVSKTYGIPVGAYVTSVTENGAADRAGIQAKDIITKFDGKSVSSFDSLQNIIRYYAAGETVPIVVMRQSVGGYQETELTITLSSAEEAGINQTQNMPQTNETPDSGYDGEYGNDDFYNNPFRYFFGD